MNRLRPTRPVLFNPGVVIACFFLWCMAPALCHAAHINVIELDNKIISPVSQQYIEEAIDRSERDGAACLVIKLDTPGGLLESTRAIVKRIMSAKVPIAVYVAPSGSRAGSAGVFITMAAHVAAMAPSTNIGAAHPVTAGGGGPGRKLVKRVKRLVGDKEKRKKDKNVQEEVIEEEEKSPMDDKILNDTVAWVTTIAQSRGRNEEWAKKAVTKSVSATETEALKENIIDIIAFDVPDLLNQMEGRTVKVGGSDVKLATKGATVIDIPMNPRQQFLSVITNPNVAYLLMMLGTMGLIFEFTHPGIGFPGIAGLICILLAMYAFQTLPISYVAVALVVIGLGLLVAEAVVISHGLLAVGGVISLTLGSLMFFESPDPNFQVSLSIIVPTIATLAAIILFVVHRAVRVQTQPVSTGAQGLIGEIGRASTELKPYGKVFVHGETWSAHSSRPLKKGARVRVKQVEGLQLVVEPATKGGG